MPRIPINYLFYLKIAADSISNVLKEDNKEDLVRWDYDPN